MPMTEIAFLALARYKNPLGLYLLSSQITAFSTLNKSVIAKHMPSSTCKSFNKRTKILCIQKKASINSSDEQINQCSGFSGNPKTSFAMHSVYVR